MPVSLYSAIVNKTQYINRRFLLNPAYLQGILCKIQIIRLMAVVCSVQIA